MNEEFFEKWRKNYVSLRNAKDMVDVTTFIHDRLLPVGIIAGTLSMILLVLSEPQCTTNRYTYAIRIGGLSVIAPWMLDPPLREKRRKAAQLLHDTRNLHNKFAIAHFHEPGYTGWASSKDFNEFIHEEEGKVSSFEKENGMTPRHRVICRYSKVFDDTVPKRTLLVPDND